MKGIEVPDREEDFTADPVELFFDLAYVFAFSQLVGHVVHHPNWTGVGEAALLFWLLWLPWSQFTWAANAVSGNGRAVRTIFVVGTAISVPMAASVSTAFGDGGLFFSLTLSGIILLGIATLGVGARESGESIAGVLQWSSAGLVTMVIIVLGGFVDGNARVWIWIVAALSVVVAMIVAGRNEWVVRPGHFAERHGLIFIIALGEVIVAIGVPVVASLEQTPGLPASTALALLGAGAFAGLMWWSYFDRASPALEHRAEGLVGGLEKGHYARDVYTVAHAPIVAGVILAAAALEEIALHPEDAASAAFRWMLFGGVGLVTLGLAVAVWRAYRAVPRERVAAVATIAVVVAVSSSWDGWLLVLAVDAVIAASIVVEHLRIEK